MSAAQNMEVNYNEYFLNHQLVLRAVQEFVWCVKIHIYSEANAPLFRKEAFSGLGEKINNATEA